MNFLSDILLAAAALGAAIYCVILSRRLSALTSLDGGLGSAIAILSAQVDDLTKLLNTAQKAAGRAQSTLADQSARAEAASNRLELLLASMHDLPPAPTPERMRAPSRWPVDPPRSTSAAPVAPVAADLSVQFTKASQFSHPPSQPFSQPPSQPLSQPRARVLRRRHDAGGQ